MRSALPFSQEPLRPAPLDPAPLSAEEANAPQLPPQVQAAVWRGAELGAQVNDVVSTGWLTLDEQLPGGGLPCVSLTEVLKPQPLCLRVASSGACAEPPRGGWPDHCRGWATQTSTPTCATGMR